MKRFITRLSVLLFAVLLVSCGGGGSDSPGGGSSPGTSGGGTAPATDTGTPPPPPATDTGTPPPTTDTGTPPPPTDAGTPPPPTGGGTLPSAGALVESDTTAVSLTGAWEPSDPLYGWSGGGARQSAVAGAKATFRFIGTSVTWIGGRSRDAGIALVSVDGGAPKRVDLFSRAREARTPVLTIHDLSAGEHTLTIEVTGLKNDVADSNVVIVDAFEVEAPIVSRLQDTDTPPPPSSNILVFSSASFSAGWTQAPGKFPPGGIDAYWSGCCVATGNDAPAGGAKVTETAGETVTFKFRGTSVRWLGYLGPNAGIAHVQVDDREPEVVDLYSPTRKIQVVVFTASGLAPTEHTLRITATGMKADASTGAQVVVDAFEVITPGRRYQENYVPPAGPVGVPPDPNRATITYTGPWDFLNLNRPWSEGNAYTSTAPGARVDFTFAGTSVSWIGSEKLSIGRARVSIDGAVMAPDPLILRRDSPIEAYQKTVYRIDGLPPGLHTLTIESLTTGPIVVDAFDVRP